MVGLLPASEVVVAILSRLSAELPRFDKHAAWPKLIAKKSQSKGCFTKHEKTVVLLPFKQLDITVLFERQLCETGGAVDLVIQKLNSQNVKGMDVPQLAERIIKLYLIIEANAKVVAVTHALPKKLHGAVTNIRKMVDTSLKCVVDSPAFVDSSGVALGGRSQVWNDGEESFKDKLAKLRNDRQHDDGCRTKRQLPFNERFMRNRLSSSEIRAAVLLAAEYPTPTHFVTMPLDQTGQRCCQLQQLQSRGGDINLGGCIDLVTETPAASTILMRTSRNGFNTGLVGAATAAQVKSVQLQLLLMENASDQENNVYKTLTNPNDPRHENIVATIRLLREAKIVETDAVVKKLTNLYG